ncbi:MAG: flagellar hook capping FlgD N-terminal domain-containing protein [Gemmobacter sp.]
MQTSTVTTAPGSFAAATRPAARNGADFQTFLRMLTVQLQNQDPLNPMQSTDFAVQLATFSGVEQQVRTNQMLETLAGQLGVANLAQLSGWIGMEARIAAPVHLDGRLVTIEARPDPQADSAVLVVTDPAGREVVREAVGLAAGPLIWAGVDAAGRALPPGTYRLELESLVAGELLSRSEVEHYATIREARSAGNGAVTLVFDGGVTAPATAVGALRRPD